MRGFLFRFFLCALICIFLQATILHHLPFSVPVPNLLLSLVVFLAFCDFSPLFALLAFALGFLLDLHSGIRFGPWAGAFTVAYYVLGVTAQQFLTHRKASYSVAAVVVTFVANCVYQLLYLDFRFFTVGSLLAVCGEIVMMALITPFLLPLWDRILGWPAKKEFRSGGRSVSGGRNYSSRMWQV